MAKFNVGDRVNVVTTPIMKSIESYAKTNVNIIKVRSMSQTWLIQEYEVECYDGNLMIMWECDLIGADEVEKPEKCRHEWKIVGYSLHNIPYEDCTKCGAQKDKLPKDEIELGEEWDFETWAQKQPKRYIP